MIPYDEQDKHTAALCAWKEARGDGREGMRAVLHVIWNRAQKVLIKGGDPVHRVVYAKNQFTSMSDSRDPEFNLEPRPFDVSFSTALDLANDLPTDIDPTGGALYYANLATMDKGGWFDRNIVDNPKHPRLAVIGHHSFFA